MMPWLYIHFPCLQLDGLLQTQSLTLAPNATTTALIIVNSNNNQVVQLNHLAAEQGVCKGMGLAGAIAHCEQLRVVEYDPDHQSQRLNELAQWLYQVAADIALFEPDGLALETTTMLSLYGDLKTYWSKITSVLTPQQVHYQGGLGATPMAARLIAKHYHHSGDDVSWLQVSRTQYEQQLETLNVIQLELPERQIEQLQRVGIHQLKQLSQLSNKDLGRRFGLELLEYLNKLEDQAKSGLNYYHPPSHFQQYLELFHEINQTQVLLFPLKRMVQEMARFLLTHQWMVTSLTITLHYRHDNEEDNKQALIINSGEGEYQAERWMRLISLKVERTELTAPVIGLSLSTDQMLEQTLSNEDLFDSTKGHINRQQLISILQAKVGKTHIKTLQLQADHRPEKAFHYADSNHNPGPVDLSQLPKHRPSILLPQAKRLTEHYTIIQGPERIRTVWWSHEGIYRDYFIATNSQGVKCWLFNDPEQGWFLQGYFC